MTTAELLAQLTDLITETQTHQADADNWRVLRDFLADRGYGPRITPQQIAHLIPDAAAIADLMASTQEVVDTPAAPKSDRTMPRRRLTQDDKLAIETLLERDALLGDAEIAGLLGLAVNSVGKYVAQRAGRP